MEDVFKRIFDAAPDAILVIDHLGTIILANDRVNDVFGYERNELIGKELELLIPVIQVQKHRQYREQFLKAPVVREMGKGRELTARRKNGKTVSVEISLSPIRTLDNVFVAAAIRDVTERKHLLNELKRREHLVTEQNQRLLNFAHIVSHNLRSHAGNFTGLMNLYDSARSQEDKDELITHIRKVSSSLTETISHLNEVVSMQTTIWQQRKPVNVHEYVIRTLEVLRNDLLANHVVVSLHVPSDLVIEYNAAYLESILLNLLSNTIKYRHPTRVPNVKVSTLYEGPKLALTVADNGRGIDLVQSADKLFGMYKTFHGNADARGIGLFITKNQVEAMGGSIEVQSEVDVGTTFKVYLT